MKVKLNKSGTLSLDLQAEVQCQINHPPPFDFRQPDLFQVSALKKKIFYRDAVQDSLQATPVQDSSHQSAM